MAANPNAPYPYPNPAFNEKYEQTRSPRVQTLRAMPQGNLREAFAIQISQMGEIVDFAIDVYGYDPFYTMWERENWYGLTWVPSMSTPSQYELGQGTAFPGFVLLPGQTAYNPDPPFPPHAITVTTDPAKL